MSPSFSVSVRVPATSANLGPGFDALGMALDLWNELELQVSPQDALLVSGEGVAQLQRNASTVAHTAAHRVFQSLAIPVSGVSLRLTNNVPLSRGLGSSSAAIVGGLVAANEWARRSEGRALESAQILNLANEIEGHPDNVAPALLGGLVVSVVGMGGRVTSLRVPVPRWPHFVVWIPVAELATKSARAILPHSYSREDAVFNLSRASLLVAALAVGDRVALAQALDDRIHQPFRGPLLAGWDALTRAGCEAGAFGSTLSGSGPTLLFWTESAEHAQRVMARLESVALELGITGRALRLDAAAHGATVVA